MKPLRILLLATLAAFPSAHAAFNDWPQNRYDETHQGAVPASLNAEFSTFTSQWWKNLSLPGSVGSPAVREDIVYYGDSTGKLWAYDRESGGILWSNTTGNRISGTPAVGQDYVYVVNEAGALYSFNRKTGTVQNGYPISPGATFGSPLLHEDTIYVGSSSGTVTAYFVSTRQQRWSFSAQGSWGSGSAANITTCSGGSVDGTPVLFEQWIFFGSTNKCFFAVPRTSFGSVAQTDVSFVFKAEDSIRTTAAIDRVNRRVIFGDVSGNIYSLPVQSSSQRVTSPTWSFKEPIVEGRPSEFKASPAITTDKVIVGARNGNVRALSLSTGASLWVRNLNGEVVGSPAIANGMILVGSFDRKAYTLNVSDGSIRDSRVALAEIDTSPAISGTQGFWADKLGNLYSWGGQKPERPDIAITSLSASLTRAQSSAISFTIRNIGTQQSSNTSGVFFLANTKIGEVQIPSLEPGAEHATSFAFVPTPSGATKLTFFVDAIRQIKESDEANNEKTIDVSISEPPPPPPIETSSSGAGPGPSGGWLLLVLLLGVVLVGARRRNRERSP